jgi:hypothetical protein
VQWRLIDPQVRWSSPWWTHRTVVGLAGVSSVHAPCGGLTPTRLPSGDVGDEASPLREDGVIEGDIIGL